MSLNEKATYFNTHFIEDWNVINTKETTEERAFVETNGGKLNKFSFTNTNIKGSGFVFKSKTWRSHHNPEYCITAGGREIVKSETLKINNNTIKKILLDNGQHGYYWFQNKKQTTDDFGTRIWNEIFKQKTDWFLVCVIFNSNNNKNNYQKENFIKQIKNQL